MDERISFDWDGIKIAGILDIPDGAKGPIPAFVILHGFGANKDSGSVPAMAKLLTNRGYASLRLDMPGVGESGGVVGKLVCLEQVAVARRGIDYLETRAEIDNKRIGVGGASFGAAVSIYTGGADERVAAVISSGGWGNGARKAKLQHPPPEAYDKFITMVEEGRKKVAGGETMMVPRYDIVPIPEHLRSNLDITSLMEFHVETAIGIFDFRPEDMVGKISPRPLLLLHPTNDSVTPVSETMELFASAGENTDVHLLADVDHFMFSEDNIRVSHVIGDWLDKFFPLDATAIKDAAE
jgi:pimeloyl-ACP methyl ester carboxylesterase